MDNKFNIKEKIKELYKIVKELEANCSSEEEGKRPFTLDGHLVGSIGEVYARDCYGLKLFKPGNEKHDAESKDGRLVQIKTTQITSIGLSSKPKYLLVLQIQKNGEIDEIYNGPGEVAWDAAGKMQNNGQKRIYISKLKKLMDDISIEDRLERYIK